MPRPVTSDVRVAPHIYRTTSGWRVYVRRDGKLAPKRFPASYTLEQLEAFVDGFKEESAKLARTRKAVANERAGTFAGDADRYLKLKVVKAMPSYKDRCHEIGKWKTAFGARPRASLTASDINEQLQAWRTAGASGSSVNKYRSALMALYTRLDGRSAANIVKETKVFEEAEQVARGVDYALLECIFAAIPATRSRPVKGKKGSRDRGNLSRVRIGLMLWTAMTPAQIRLLQPEHVNLKDGWYVSPRRQKGQRDLRNVRPLVRKPMTAKARQAFKEFIDAGAWGDFDRRSLRQVWLRALKAVERERRKAHPKFTMPHVRLYDIRHSFGTRLFRATKDLRLVGEMLDHTSEKTTRRYAIGAVPEILTDGMRQFELDDR